MIVAFLLLLLLHGFLALPLLVRKRKPWAYAAVTLVLLAAFVAYVLLGHQTPGPEMRPPMPPDGAFPPPPDGAFPPEGPGGPPLPGGPGGPGPLRPEVFEILLGVLLLAASVGIFYWIQASRSAKRIRELESEIRRRDEQKARPVPAAEALYFRSEGKEYRVDPARIRYVEGMSEYAKIWLDDMPEPLVVLERLKNLQARFPAGTFLRVHRSYIVNLDRVRATGANGITLDDGTHIPVGDSHRQEVRNYLAANMK